MQGNVVVLNNMVVAAYVPGLESAEQAMSKAWQRGTFKFSLPLENSLKRTADFMQRNNDRLRALSYALSADFEPGTLDEILKYQVAGRPWNENELEVIVNQFDAGRDTLKELIDFLQATQVSMASLPTPDVDAIRSKLTGEQARIEQARRPNADILQKKKAQLESVNAAMDILEKNNIESVFNGLLPSEKDLKKATSVVTAGQIDVELVCVALEKLSKGLERSLANMRYASLITERQNLVNRIRDVEATTREQDVRLLELAKQLGKLEEFGALREHSLNWQGIITQVLVAQVAFSDELAQIHNERPLPLAKLSKVYARVSDYHNQLQGGR